MSICDDFTTFRVGREFLLSSSVAPQSSESVNESATLLWYRVWDGLLRVHSSKLRIGLLERGIETGVESATMLPTVNRSRSSAGYRNNSVLPQYLRRIVKVCILCSATANLVKDILTRKKSLLHYGKPKGSIWGSHSWGRKRELPPVKFIVGRKGTFYSLKEPVEVWLMRAKAEGMPFHFLTFYGASKADELDCNGGSNALLFYQTQLSTFAPMREQRDVLIVYCKHSWELLTIRKPKTLPSEEHSTPLLIPENPNFMGSELFNPTTPRLFWLPYKVKDCTQTVWDRLYLDSCSWVR